MSPERKHADEPIPKKGPVLIVDPVDSTRARLAEAMKQMGWEIIECETPRLAYRMATTEKAVAVIVDWDLAGERGPDIVELLAEEEATREMPVVTCGADASPEGGYAALRAGAIHHLVKPVDTTGLATLLENLLGLGPPELPVEQREPLKRAPTNRSLYARSLQCAFHESPTEFYGYCLRSKTQFVDMNLFDIPRYAKAVRGADHCNFLLVEVRVCPDCFFATNEDRYYHMLTKRTGAGLGFSPARKARVLMERGAAKRGKQGKPLGEHVWNEERTPAEALAAYQLAILSSRTLYDSDPLSFVLELCRIAGYHLKSAEIALKLIDDAARHDHHLGAALETLEKTYLELPNNPNLFRVLCQLVSLMVWFGRDADARRYLARFQSLKSTAMAGMIERHQAIFRRYYDSAVAVYDDRDYIRERAVP